MKVVLDPGAKMPERAHKFDAGLDLFAKEQITVPAHSRASCDTGVHIQIPQGFDGMLTSKSGLMRKDGITCRGTIDSGYTGSIQAVLFNHSDKDKVFNPGDKVTQLVIYPIEIPFLKLVETLDETERGENGFGSTGD